MNQLQETLSKEILEYEYKNLGSLRKVANKLNISIDIISKYFKLYEIPYSKHYSGIYSCNHDIFKEENEVSFYLAGFIAADGCVMERKYSKIIKITLSEKDREHLEKIRKLLESDHPITSGIVNSTKLIKTQNRFVSLSIVSKIMFEDLKKFNIVPRKTKIYNFPTWLVSHSLVHHFMRGYFDGDGCIAQCGLSKGRKIKQKHFGILGTREFIENYQNLLIKNCGVNRVKIKSRGNVYNLSYAGNTNIGKIYSFLYKDSEIYLERKKELFR